MSRVLANLLAIWVFAISPVLCVSGVMPDLCGDSDCCDFCTDCAPHTPLCAEDSCHQIVIPPLRIAEECDLAVAPDNGQVPHEAVPASDADGPASQVLTLAPCPERAPPSPSGLAFTIPLLI